MGKTDLQVSPINLGGNVFGWTINEQQSFEVLDAFADRGYNFIDTADTYSWWVEGNRGGESESIIGKWMKQKGNRDKMIIATKVGSQNKVHPADTRISASEQSGSVVAHALLLISVYLSSGHSWLLIDVSIVNPSNNKKQTDNQIELSDSCPPPDPCKHYLFGRFASSSVK